MGQERAGVCRRRLPSAFEGKIRESRKASEDYRERKNISRFAERVRFFASTFVTRHREF